MKLIFTLLFSFSICGFILAQDIMIYEKDNDSLTADKFTEMYGIVKVQNTGTKNNEYAVLRNEVSMVPGHISYYCWNISCYGDSVDLSIDSTILAPGEKDSTFYGYLRPYDTVGGYTGTSVVNYKIFNTDPGEPEDTVSFTYIYTATELSGVQTKILTENDFYAYPNPAVNTLNIAFNDLSQFSNAEVVLRNILGSELKRQKVNIRRNLTEIDISELGRGVYFYSVVLDGKVFQTKKFAVTK